MSNCTTTHDSRDNAGMAEVRIVLTTLDNADRANELAHEVVEKQLAACVNMIDGVHSVYRWKGRVDGAHEVLLIIKTTAERVPELTEKILQYHSYELPEVVVFNVTGGSGSYLDWLVESCSADKTGIAS